MPLRALPSLSDTTQPDLPLANVPLGAMPAPVLGELGRQARVVEALGSSFTARVLAALDATLAMAPQCAAAFAAWPCDRAEAALAMRMNAALQFVARSERMPDLTELYRCQSGDFEGVIGRALARFDSELAQWLAHPTQTNEIARSAAFAAALKVAGEQFGMQFELLEIGSSAGLNLNMEHYRYTLGGRSFGPQDSPVHIAPRWRGAPPPDWQPEIASAQGVDLAPVNLADPQEREKLHAYIWADKKTRHIHLDLALDLAQAARPKVSQGDALDWLTVRLAARPVEGRCRVVMHSMVLQYIAPDRRGAIGHIIDEAIINAPPQSPLVQIGMEWSAPRDEVRLTLKSRARAGELRSHLLAICHPYGDWIDWRYRADL